MELTGLPRRLVIVGGGYIGLEFASMYASFGSQVTVLESYPELIAREDVYKRQHIINHVAVLVDINRVQVELETTVCGTLFSGKKTELVV